ncbi:unnamed protein product [Didymodactylos carnosus]|uniref:Uncharacterized protein n=1 Tax=Didymodactylos carnosus TaxID=1234261 RepID=A0A816E9D1_9BILA|nr:unnamed protein product [Didymodactylos carnosus]CAF4575025.1 unnamed protein product [Didymodactylos carnosus]
MTANDIVNSDDTNQYRFQYLEKKFESIDGKQNRDYFIKWYVEIELLIASYYLRLLTQGNAWKTKVIYVHI